VNKQNIHSYGGVISTILNDEVDRCAEELSLLGYTILSGVLPDTELDSFRQRIDTVYQRQVDEFGEAALAAIGEQDMCRAPLLYDPEFIRLAMNPSVYQVVQRVLGDWFILNLQNAVINRPDRPHHQQAWHRDLPYQNWVISRPIALGALFMVDDFSAETGGTMVLPYSHRCEASPSAEWIERHSQHIEAPAGSVLLFDAMVLHRAGYNSSSRIRRGINHLYTTPILKQQYDIPRALGSHFACDPETSRVMGFTSQVPLSVLEWRQQRTKKMSGAR
jgi:ectoine hydroxylase-related dioxygenase (phytanoyl-CoA dioxygenase family)